MATKTELFHPSVNDLYEVISKRSAIATLVLFIGSELNSISLRTKRGKDYFNKFTFGVVGVYDNRIAKYELEDDVEETKRILRI